MARMDGGGWMIFAFVIAMAITALILSIYAVVSGEKRGPKGAKGGTGIKGEEGLQGVTGPTGLSSSPSAILYRYNVATNQTVVGSTYTGVVFTDNPGTDINVGGWTTSDDASFFPPATGLFECSYSVAASTAQTGLRSVNILATRDPSISGLFTDINFSEFETTIATGGGYAVTLAGTFIAPLGPTNPVTLAFNAGGGTWTIAQPSLSCHSL